MGLGWSRRYDANVVGSPRIHDDEQSAQRSDAERDESLLFRIRVVILDRDGVGVAKDGNRFGHADAVLAKVDPGFARLIPLEAHSSSVRTSCAYVNSDLRGDVGACGAIAGTCDSCVQIASKTEIASKLRPNSKHLSVFESASTVRN